MGMIRPKGSFEDRLERLRSEDISDDCKIETISSAPAQPRAPAGSRYHPGRPYELSDQAAELIAKALKSFLGS